MVSLGEDNRRVAAFMDSQDAAICTNDSEELLAGVAPGEDKSFRPIRTLPTIICIILLTIILEVVIFVVPELYGKHHSNDNIGYASILYTHAVIWFLILLCDRLLYKEHYLSRSYGYLEFYRQTRRIRQMPFVIYSGGNALLLVMVVVLQDYCPTDGKCSSLLVSRVNLIQILISIEVLIIIPVITVYLVTTVRFNNQRAPPDVYQDDLMAVYTRRNTSAPDVGFKDDEFHEDIMERQADLIRYLKQSNVNLARKVLHLTEELKLCRKA